MAEAWSLAWASDLSQPCPKKKEKKKIFLKNYFKKICDFLQIFYCILINIGLYFYTVKIQIRY
jgi:hypothetical protein